MTPVMPGLADQSARIAIEAPAQRFDLGEQLAKLGQAEDFDNLAKERLSESEERRSGSGNVQKLSGSGYSEKLSGSGYLPVIENLRWESNGQGGWEAWHCPPEAIHRRQKTYLGYLGVRNLRKWEKESPERFRELVIDWVAEKRKGKGIEL